MFNSKWKTHWWVISQIYHEAACECKGVFNFLESKSSFLKINLPQHINGRHPDRKSIHKEILGRVQTGRADEGFEDASRFFSKADSREQKEPVVSEEASMENKHYKIKAVALGYKGSGTAWKSIVGMQKTHNGGPLPQAKLNYLVTATPRRVLKSITLKISNNIFQTFPSLGTSHQQIHEKYSTLHYLFSTSFNTVKENVLKAQCSKTLQAG